MEPVVRTGVRRWAALLAVAVVGVSAAVSVAPAQAQAADCGKVELVTFRGSGESAVDDGDASNGLSGATLHRVIDRAREMTEGDFTLSGSKVFGVPYPAIAADKYLSKNLDLFDSIEYGRLLGGGYIKKRRKECETTRFLLAGYSQGVLAARQVAADLPKDWVAGVFGLGDPAQKANARGVTGSGASGNGIYRWLIERDGKASSDAYYDLGLPSYLYCHTFDPVCDALHFVPKWPPLDFGPHTNYGIMSAEKDALAGQLVTMAAAAADRPVPPPATAGAADVMFVIDTTGSMTPYLEAAVDSASQTADALHAVTPAARVGLVEYRDYGDAYPARTVVPLTNDFDAFDAGLRTLVASGGGDTPEAVYTGVVTALGAGWNRSASRSLIVLGDAPAHDPEPVTGLTAAIVTEVAKGVAPLPELPPTVGGADSRVAVPAEPEQAPQTEPAIPGQEQNPNAPVARTGDTVPMAVPGETVPPVAVYALSASTDLTTQFTPISDATGGKALPIESPDDVTQSIIDTVEDAATAPTARLTAADTVLVGNETVLSGLSSTYVGEEASFAFDFDNDGTVDETTTEAAVTHKYSTAGAVEARLVVTDSRGRTSKASANIEVRTRDSLQAPGPVTSTPPSTTPPTTSPSATGPGGKGDDTDLASTGVAGLSLLVTLGLLLLTGGMGARLSQLADDVQEHNVHLIRFWSRSGRTVAWWPGL